MKVTNNDTDPLSRLLVGAGSCYIQLDSSLDRAKNSLSTRSGQVLVMNVLC